MSFSPIVVNCKVYEELLGGKMGELAIASKKVGNIQLAPPLVDLGGLAASYSNLVAQHLDSHGFGAATGWQVPSYIAGLGVRHTLLNHAEHKLPKDLFVATLKAAKDAGFSVMACADSPEEAAWLAGQHVDAIAIEPPELIGGDISVTTANPEIISKSVSQIRKLNSKVQIFCGAGIKTGADVAAARKLGCFGVLLASGVTKSDNFLQTLQDLATGI